MDIGFFTTYTEPEVLQRMDEWNKEFITGRGVMLDAFLLDDGWDDRTGRWLFGPAFSNGFSKVREKADSLHSSIGLWLSPGADITSRGIFAYPMLKNMASKPSMENLRSPALTILKTLMHRLLI